MKEAVVKFLDDNNYFLITSHPHPDGDAIGSCLAIQHFLRRRGKKAVAIINDTLPEQFSFLPGFDSLKRGTPPFTPRTLISVDVSKPERLGEFRKYLGKIPVLNIDHHPENPNFGDINIVDPSAASSSLIIWELFCNELDLEETICLFTGLVTDTGWLTQPHSDPRAWKVAAQMIERGVQAHIIASKINTRPFKSQVLMGKALSRLKKVGQFLWTYIENKDYKEIEADDSHTEGIIEEITKTPAKLYILIREIEPGKNKVSLRSRELNVLKLAKKLGGGGHEKAAGCIILGPVKRAAELVLEEAHKLWGHSM